MSELVVHLVGDINLRKDLQFDDHCLDDVIGLLGEADLRFGNLEGAFSDPNVELPYKLGWYHAQPEMVNHLVGNFDVVGCANNVHYGAAIADSARLLDEHGIVHAGSGANDEQAHRPAEIERDGTRFGLLAYTSVFEPVGHSAGEASPGVATIKGHTSYEPSPRVLQMPGAPALVHTWPEKKDLARAAAEVAALAERVDVAVVYMHWGVSSNPTVHEYQHDIGHALVEAGATIVAGSHAHTPQAVEFYRGGLICYGLGNFVFGSSHARFATRDGILVELVLDGKSVAQVAAVPVQRNGQDRTERLHPAAGDGQRIFELVRTRCAEFGTKAEVEGDRIVLRA
jgi:poly-gamma-glutamate synthesis protein (capsule biosynthesis protein)